MVIEFLLLGIASLFLAQGSSFFSRLILIPIRVIVMLQSNSVFTRGGFWFYVFIIVFIGGLLILLVSITSTSVQDQSFTLTVILLFLIILRVVLQDRQRLREANSFIQISWLTAQNNLILVISLLLLLSLIVITWNVLTYKGAFRSICPYGV